MLTSFRGVRLVHRFRWPPGKYSKYRPADVSYLDTSAGGKMYVTLEEPALSHPYLALLAYLPLTGRPIPVCRRHFM